MVDFEDVISSTTHIWVSPPDAKQLMDRGMVAASSWTLLRAGVVGFVGKTKVYIDHLLGEGFVRLLDGRTLRVSRRTETSRKMNMKRS